MLSVPSPRQWGHPFKIQNYEKYLKRSTFDVRFRLNLISTQVNNIVISLKINNQHHELLARCIHSMTWSSYIPTTHSMLSRKIRLYGYIPPQRSVSMPIKTHFPSGARINRKNPHRCHLGFANAIVAPRRMAQFSASPQIGLFQSSLHTMEPLPLQHDVKLAKMLTKTAGYQKAVNRSWVRFASVLLPFCLPSAFAMVMIGG